MNEFVVLCTLAISGSWYNPFATDITEYIGTTSIARCGQLAIERGASKKSADIFIISNKQHMLNLAHMCGVDLSACEYIK